MYMKGEIKGSGSLLINGTVEGDVNLAGYRVIIGRDGKVTGDITARDIIVLGNVRGNVSATDRVDIRAEGMLSGDIAATRISIEDGAYFKGGIDIHKPGPNSSDFREHEEEVGARGALRSSGSVWHEEHKLA